MPVGRASICHQHDHAQNTVQVVEMTNACVTFLGEKFVDFDEDGDRLLSAPEQAEMFSTAPSRCAPLAVQRKAAITSDTGCDGT